MPDTAAILNEAYGFIEQGELPRARTLLQPLLESDSQNPDVWWLYTHAAADENEGRLALDRVLALDPAYPGASELRQRLGSTPRVLKPLSSLKPVSTPAAPMTPVPAPVSTDEPSLDDDDVFAETESPAAGRSRSGLVILAGVAILIIAVLLFGVTLLNQPTESTPTSIADLTTPTGLTTADLTSTLVDGAATAVDATAVGADVTVDPFSLTATALIPTSAVAQAATQEASPTALTTEEVAAASPTMASTPAEATSETALLPSSTQEIEATVDVSTSETSTPEQSITEAPVVTESVAATQEITPQDATVAATVTDESTLILPTESLPATPEITPTEQSDMILTEAVTPESTPDVSDRLVEALAALNVTRENIIVAQTTLGPTLIVGICAAPVSQATTALTTAMTALAETAAETPDIDAVGVNLACDSARPRVIAVPASTAAAFGRGEIDVRTFRQGWQPTDLIETEGNG